MPKLIEFPVMVTVVSAVAVANCIHPFIHSAEGGAVDAALDNLTQYSLAWLNSKGI